MLELKREMVKLFKENVLLWGRSGDIRAIRDNVNLTLDMFKQREVALNDKIISAEKVILGSKTEIDENLRSLLSAYEVLKKTLPFLKESQSQRDTLQEIIRSL